MHAADALTHAELSEKIVNTDNTEFDIEARKKDVVKCVPMTKTKK